MLVLSRREGERIRIGDSVTVTVVRCAGDKVRIGIEAPNDLLILRGELEQYAKKKADSNTDDEQRTRKHTGAPVDYNGGANVTTTVF